MKKKFIFLGLLFGIQVPLLSMERVSKEETDGRYLQIHVQDHQLEKEIEENPYCLIDALKKNDIEKVKELISAGADLNILDNKGYTALHIATICNNIAIISLIKEKSTHTWFKWGVERERKRKISSGR